MTKTAFVICFFIGVSVFVLLSWKYLESNRPVKEAVLSNSIASSRGFGELLRPSVTPTSNDDSVLARNKKITELLANLDKSTAESVSDWQERQNKNLIEVDPTPYIPLPSLIAGVSELAITPKPTLAPNLENFLFEEELQQLPTEIDEDAVDSINIQNTTNIGNINVNPIKTTYVLAVLGDSMVETLGPNLSDLDSILTSTFPKYSIALLNYGQGATDMDSGLYRLTHTTKYLGKIYPALLSFKPDILVVESFAYNPWSANQFDLDRQWLTIAKIIDTVKAKSPGTKIILAATIAPNPFTFGDGVLNWGADLKWVKAQTVRAYLTNLVNFATSGGYPLADAFHPSLAAGGHGDSRFINSGDHLHPSEAGKKLFSEKIVEAIKTNNLLQ